LIIAEGGSLRALSDPPNSNNVRPSVCLSVCLSVRALQTLFIDRF